jgi:hypothetical protein
MSEPLITMLQVPMRETASIALQESLTITFTEDCCFCCDPDQVGNFTPPLPRGDQKAGYVWNGVAIIPGTINFYHSEYGKGQGEKHKLTTGSRSIQVGD